MDIKKKDKTKILGMALFLIVVISYTTYFQKIEIIYFTNPGCKLSENTDILIDYIEYEFQDKVIVRKINIQMYPGDEEDTQEIKKLREKYKVYGIPHIIINGKKFTSEYTKNNLEENICNEFIIKPDVCK